jgi:hypothetical protein
MAMAMGALHRLVHLTYYSLNELGFEISVHFFKVHLGLFLETVIDSLNMFKSQTSTGMRNA